MNREERELFASVICLGSDYHDKILPEYLINVYDLEHFLSLHEIVDFVNNGGLLSEFQPDVCSYTHITSEGLLMLPDIVYGEAKPQTLEEKIKSYSQNYARCLVEKSLFTSISNIKVIDLKKVPELEEKYRKFARWVFEGSLEVMKS